MNAVDLTPVQLVLAGALVLVAGLVSVAASLDLERKLAIGAVRTVVQLLLVGLVLERVFSWNHPLVVAGIGLIMVSAAARAAIRRPSRTFRGAWVGAFGTLGIVGFATVTFVTEVVVKPGQFWAPRYLIPLLGMILGNSLTGISLCIDTLLERFDAGRAEVEELLALGATRAEAARDVLRDAVRRGMIPILNSMAVVGIVSLPGMMTGQILAGADPLVAVEYQIVVMFMLAASTSLGAIAVAVFATRQLFDGAHRLRAERVRRWVP